MLDTMRGIAKGVIAKALMMMLVISFAVWGVGDIVRGGNGYLAKVGDGIISPGEYMNETRNTQRMMEQLGMQADAKAISNQVLQRLIQQELVKKWREDTGLSVNRETLARTLSEMSEFKNFGGKFDKDLYEKNLEARGITEAQYLSDLGAQLGSKVMLLSIDSSDIKAAASMLALSAASGLQTRDAVVLTIPGTAVPPSSLSMDEVKEYYEDHASQYVQSEQRTLEYVVIPQATLEKLAPADAPPEQREQAVSEMSMQVEDALAGGSSMTEALSEAGIKEPAKTLADVPADKYTNGDALLNEVVTQGFQLGEGESSGLMATPDGKYFIVTVAKITPEAPQALEKVEAQVRQAAAKEKTREATKDRVQALKDALAKGEDWKKAAAANKAQARVVTRIERPMIGLDGSVKSTGPVPALLGQAIFERAVGDVAGPLLRENGDQMLALVTGVHSKEAANETLNIAAESEYRAQLDKAVMNAVLNDLQKKYPIKVNDRLRAQIDGDGNE